MKDNCQNYNTTFGKRLGRDEILETVNSISYKPNWKIKVIVDYDIVFLGVESSDITDVQTLRPTRIVSKTLIPIYYLNEREILINFIRDKIYEIEEHEADEWFKVAGKRLREPH